MALKKIIIRFVDYILRKLSRWRLDINPNIVMADGVQIHPSAKIETRFGGKITIGKGSKIHDGVLIFSYGGDIVIGENCDINCYTIIYGHGGVTIGNNVLMAGHCMIIPANHVFTDPTKLIDEQGLIKSGISIDQNVWIGHSASVLDGVCIGKGVVVAAGSVVNKSVEEYSMVGGVPAKKIRKIE